MTNIDFSKSKPRLTGHDVQFTGDANGNVVIFTVSVHALEHLGQGEPMEIYQANRELIHDVASENYPATTILKKSHFEGRGGYVLDD